MALLTAYETWHNLAFFEGHLIVVFIWLIPSVWCTINILTNYHRERLSNGRRQFRSRLWYPGPFTRTVPLDSILKLFVIGFQYLLLFTFCIVKNAPCNFNAHAQHAVLYTAFFGSSLVELMTCYGSFDLPEGMDRLANMVAYLVLTVVFVFHSGHSSLLNDTMHSRVLPYSSLAIVGSLLMEGVQPMSFFVAMMRPYLVMFIGLYFLHLGYTLFPVFPWQMPLDGDDPRNLNIVPMLVCFYLILVLFVFLVLNCLVVYRLRRPNLLHSNIPKHEKCTKCEKCEPLLVVHEH